MDKKSYIIDYDGCDDDDGQDKKSYRQKVIPTKSHILQMAVGMMMVMMTVADLLLID